MALKKILSTLSIVAISISIVGCATVCTAGDKDTSKAKTHIYFKFDHPKPGKEKLDAEQNEIAKYTAEVMNKNSRTTAVLEGHCDRWGSSEYNLALGERRANAVKSSLVKEGVSDERLETRSFGKEQQPYPDAQDEETDAKNRVVIVKIN